MSEVLYTVYKHTTPSGKSYIGITKNSIKARIGGGYRHNKYMTSAIEKYGWENIVTEIIAEDVTLDEANLLESYYIASLETTDHRNGYNICNGGLSWNSKADEVRKKLSEAAKKRHTPIGPETRKKLLKLSMNKKPVLCVETGEVYPSFGEAMRQTGIDRYSISKCCSGKLKTAGKFHWRCIDGRSSSHCGEAC